MCWEMHLSRSSGDSFQLKALRSIGPGWVQESVDWAGIVGALGAGAQGVGHPFLYAPRARMQLSRRWR